MDNQPKITKPIAVPGSVTLGIGRKLNRVHPKPVDGRVGGRDGLAPRHAHSGDRSGHCILQAQMWKQNHGILRTKQCQSGGYLYKRTFVIFFASCMQAASFIYFSFPRLILLYSIHCLCNPLRHLRWRFGKISPRPCSPSRAHLFLLRLYIAEHVPGKQCVWNIQ